MSWKKRVFFLVVIVLLLTGCAVFNSQYEEERHVCVRQIEPVVVAGGFIYHLEDGPFETKKIYHKGTLYKERLTKIFLSWEMEKVEKTVQEFLTKEGIPANVYRLIPQKITKEDCNSTIYMGLEILGPFERRGKFLLIEDSVFDRDQFFRLLLGPYAH